MVVRQEMARESLGRERNNQETQRQPEECDGICRQVASQGKAQAEAEYVCDGRVEYASAGYVSSVRSTYMISRDVPSVLGRAYLLSKFMQVMKRKNRKYMLE